MELCCLYCSCSPKPPKKAFHSYLRLHRLGQVEFLGQSIYFSTMLIYNKDIKLLIRPEIKLQVFSRCYAGKVKLDSIAFLLDIQLRIKSPVTNFWDSSFICFDHSSNSELLFHFRQRLNFNGAGTGLISIVTFSLLFFVIIRWPKGIAF